MLPEDGKAQHGKVWHVHVTTVDVGAGRGPPPSGASRLSSSQEEDSYTDRGNQRTEVMNRGRAEPLQPHTPLLSAPGKAWHVLALDSC